MPVPLRLSLLCHARTTLRPSRFPADEPLVEGAELNIRKLVDLEPTHLLAGPGTCTRQTADNLSVGAAIEPALADMDRGRWRGRSMEDIEAAEPGAIAAWMADPHSMPHGGESRMGVLARVAAWLDQLGGLEGHIIAVSYPDVLRAAIVAALDAPPSAFNAIDIEHLTVVDFRYDGRRWTMRSLGRR